MKTVCALLLLFVAGRAVVAREVSIDELLKHAKQFDGQRVTVRGIVEDGGDKLYIWADYNARKNADVDRVFIAYFDPNLPSAIPGYNYGHYAYTNARWVKVTGVVDTRLKRWGDEPFGLRLETVSVVSPRIRSLLEPLVYIRNDTARKIDAHGEFATFGGREGFDTSIRAHGYDEMAVEKGFSLSVTYTNRRIARFGPMTRSQWKNYLEPRRRAYYFRVTDKDIALVRPDDARGWRWDPDPTRD